MANYAHYQRRVSSLLELEAAEFFKLDIGYMNLETMRNKSSLDLGRHISPSRATSSCSADSLNQCSALSTRFTPENSSAIKIQPDRKRALLTRSNEFMQRPHQQQEQQKQHEHHKSVCGTRKQHQISKQQVHLDTRHRPTAHPQQETNSTRQQQHHHQHHRPKTMIHSSKFSPLRSNQRHTPSSCNIRHVTHELAACSSASSTNSLPSISSSPSVSPSLVCPHLSLDDILAYRIQGTSGSPHTVGLCSECRLDPPANVHSPLSPHFRSHRSQAADCQASDNRQQPVPRMKRGRSEHLASCQEARRRRQLAASERTPPVRQKSDLTSRVRDDSLDFGLGSSELRRMQISPSMRNSVEFIRHNSIESGRVVRIYKNGQPFEKPLRVCILRDEFSSLNHLLDHISSRMLVPNGARFLFHLDGQPVYSVHELKHGSIYVVSGKRNCDYWTSEVLKGRQLKEQQALANKQLIASGQEHRGHRIRQTEETSNSANDKLMSCAPNETAAILQTNSVIRPTKRPMRASGGREPQVRDTTNKFSRYDDSTGMSSGGLTTSIQSILAATDDSPGRPTRAKSDMSALPMRKLRKNVTFFDTGRGSSPAISNLSSGCKDSNGIKTQASYEVSLTGNELPQEDDPADTKSKLQDIQNYGSTSEIGIQVSDSIENFLIDLPVALPAKGDDSNLEDTRARPANVSNGRTAAGRRTKANANKTSAPPKQIVTITERQLSLEEMQELKDLSGGDHHHEITIKWDTPKSGGADDELTRTGQKSSGRMNRAGVELEPEVVPDRTDTIPIGMDPQPQAQQVAQKDRLITSASVDANKHHELNEMDEASNQWQYPNGRESSATPTERPVSQSGPSEMVRARVTTPTPSLSTCGDNNSLAMSYETISQSGDMVNVANRTNRAELMRSTPNELPPKERVEVRGTLFRGLNEPARNFRLVWVNGFAINDLYPENTYNVAQEWAGSNGAPAGEAIASGRVSGSTSPSARLTPGYNLSASNQQVGSLQKPAANQQFKPSERYHNWICHSRKHHELLFPAGSLIVLWCRWTNEQRYYTKHTSNVSALTLATLDLDLAASAQVCHLNERPLIVSNIHLWSLTSLNTLAVIQDEHFRLKLIFSLRLRYTKTSGCELSIAARDERQLLLFEYYQKKLPLANDTPSWSSSSSHGRNETNSISCQQQRPPSSLMMRAMKPLQSNQLPLFLLRAPNMGESRASKQETLVCGGGGDGTGEPIISFGRRHFNIWSSDPKQKKLRPMQSDQKSAKFVELVARANCLCRLSPGEFLAGDSDGNVALLLINCQHADTRPEPTGPSAKVKRPIGGGRTPITGPDASSRYSLNLINLLCPSFSSDNQANEKKHNLPDNLAKSTKPHHAITCLTRVTGSMFMSADSSCTVKFWKIKRSSRRDERKNSTPTVRLASSSVLNESDISCEQLSSISLPPDLGFICTLIIGQYNLRESIVEFYVVSTSNTILFGSVKLPSQYVRPNRAGQTPKPAQEEQRAPSQQIDLLANSSLSVVYEGHETSASSLVADFRLEQDAHTGQLAECQYFTCSLDCRICKWQGKQLVWKSLLPSSCGSLAVHPTGFVLAVGSLDGTVYILDKISGLLISYFPLTPVRINCLAYSSDGSLLAAACANGSIFMLPVYERGLKYKKVSIFQSPHPVVSLQFSIDNRYMLTSVTHGAYQELILWDLPNFRYTRDNVKLAADKIRWFDSICSGSEDVRAIWENANLSSFSNNESQIEGAKRMGQERAQSTRRVDTISTKRDPIVVNLSCHRLIKTDVVGDDLIGANYVVASDTRGYLRLFRYPSYDIQQGFFAIRISSSAVNCCRFLQSGPSSNDHFVSTSLDGSICLWTIE